MSDIIKVSEDISRQRGNKVYDIFMKEYFTPMTYSKWSMELVSYLFDGEPLFDDLMILSKLPTLEQKTPEDMSRYKFLVKDKPALVQIIRKITNDIRKIENIHNPTLHDIIYNKEFICPENENKDDYFKSHKVHSSIDHAIKLKKAYKTLELLKDFYVYR